MGVLAEGFSDFLMIGALIVAMCAGVACSKRWSTRTGWIVGIAVFAVLIVAAQPTLDTLDAARCHGDPDYQACIDGD